MRPHTLAFVPGLRSLGDYDLAGYASDDAVVEDPVIHPSTVPLIPAIPVRQRTKGYSCPRRQASYESTSPQYSDSGYSNLMAVNCHPFFTAIAPGRKPISKEPKPRRVSFGPTYARLFSDPDESGPTTSCYSLDDGLTESSPSSLPVTRRIRRKTLPTSAQPVLPTIQPEPKLHPLREEMKLFHGPSKMANPAADQAALREKGRLSKPRVLQGLDTHDSPGEFSATGASDWGQPWPSNEYFRA